MRIEAAIQSKTLCGCGIVLTEEVVGGDCICKPMGLRCSSVVCVNCFKNRKKCAPGLALEEIDDPEFLKSVQDKITPTKSSTPKSSVTTKETEEQAYSPPVVYVGRMEPTMGSKRRAALYTTFGSYRRGGRRFG